MRGGVNNDQFDSERNQYGLKEVPIGFECRCILPWKYIGPVTMCYFTAKVLTMLSAPGSKGSI